MTSELNYLVTSGTEFTLPLFDSGGANGSNAEFHIVGFVRARLHGYKANGSASNRYFDIEFFPGLAEGELGDGSGLDTGTRVIEICGFETVSDC